MIANNITIKSTSIIKNKYFLVFGGKFSKKNCAQEDEEEKETKIVRRNKHKSHHSEKDQHQNERKIMKHKNI